jgi:hypothetical protein
VEVLTPIHQDMAMFGGRVFKEVTEAKWGEWVKPDNLSPLIRGGNEDPDICKRKSM